MSTQPTPLSRYRDCAATHPPATDPTSAPISPTIDLPKGVITTRTALILPADLELKTWAALGGELEKIGNGIQWWLGDWWHYGFHRYGERKAVATAKGIKYEFGSLMNLGYVAGRVRTSLRNEVLSWSHHVAVAPLEPAEQEEWLSKAAQARWSVSKLREMLDGRKEREKPEGERAYLDAQAYAQRLIDNVDKAWGLVGPKLDIELIKLLSPVERAELADAIKRAEHMWSVRYQAIKEYQANPIPECERLKLIARGRHDPSLPTHYRGHREDDTEVELWQYPDGNVVYDKPDGECNERA